MTIQQPPTTAACVESINHHARAAFNCLIRPFGRVVLVGLPRPTDEISRACH